MILVTVGTQGPFDRLIKAVDEWALQSEVHGQHDIFAQIGPSEYEPKGMQFASSMDPIQFEELLHKADCVISHAGMGTILKALELGKPVLIMPRRASLGEQRNEHQLATAARFAKLGIVTVADDENQLREELDRLDSLTAGAVIGDSASSELIGCIRQFLWKHLGAPGEESEGS